MGSFFEDFEKKKKESAAKPKATALPSVKSTVKATVSTSPSKTVAASKQKKAAAKTSKGTSTKAKTKKATSSAAKALVERSTDRRGQLYTPVDYLRLDAKNGNTGSKKVQEARASSTPERTERVKRQNEERGKAWAKRKKELQKIKISGYDAANLSQTGRQLVREAKSAYEAAQKAGDREAMAQAHAKAERVRKQAGYSGGTTGEEFIAPKMDRYDRVGLNKAGVQQVRKARMDYQVAKEAGDLEGMKAAIRREAEVRKSLKYGATDTSKTVDAYGRSRWSGTKEDAFQEMKQVGAGFKAAGTGIAGSLLSLVETATKATDNYSLEQNWDYVNQKADELNLWKARLAMVKRGEGNQAWGSIPYLEQQVRIAENLDKLRKTRYYVDSEAPGQKLMRKSQEYTKEATQGLDGAGRFLAETAISIGQNLPGMAAAAIPGVGPAVGAALLGAQAAGAKAYELNEREVDPAEALQRGVVSGGIELLTEKIPLDNLAKLLTGKTGSTVAKNILKQMGVEAGEESASYVANYVADKIAQDPKAEWSWQELAENAAAGALSGGVFGTAGSLIGSARQENTRTNVQNSVENVETHGTRPTSGAAQPAAGLVRDDYTSRQDRKTMDEIDEISKRLGLQTRFADRVAGGMANASLQGDTVTIEKNNPNPTRFLYGHEITHRMQAVSPEAYTQFKAIIANEEGVSAQVEEVLREAEEMGIQYSWEQALDEVTADYAGVLIENERVLQKFIQDNRENKTLLQRVAAAFRALLDKLRGRDTTKVQNAVEALELALEDTIRGSRLRTGQEARVENRRNAMAERWNLDRRDDLIQRVTRDTQEGTLDTAVQAQVDAVGILNVVDDYLNGKPAQSPAMAEFYRQLQAYEAGQTRYSFKRAGDAQGEGDALGAEALQSETTRGTMEEQSEAVAQAFQRSFSGFVFSQGVSLQKEEKAAIASAVKTGNAKLGADGYDGYVNANGKQYLFETFSDGDICITGVFDADQVNIHHQIFEEEQHHDAGNELGSDPQSSAHPDPAGTEPGGGDEHHPSSGTGSPGDARLAGAESGGDRAGDGTEGPGDPSAASEPTYSPDHAHWRNAVKGPGEASYSTKKLSSYERAYETVYGKPKAPKTEQEAASQAAVGVIDRLQNLETPKPKQREAPPLPLPGEKAAVDPGEIQEEMVSPEDLAYMDSLLEACQESTEDTSYLDSLVDSYQETPEDKAALEAEFRAARDLIPGGRKDKTTLKEKVGEVTGFAYRKLVDSGDEIRKAGKQAGDKYLYYYYNQAKAATATAQNMIAMQQSDVNGQKVGESLVSIFGSVKKLGKEYATDFHDYLLHRHNIYRMGSQEERQMQRQALRYQKDFEAQHPDYKDMTMPQLREASDGGDQLAKEYMAIRKEKRFWDSRVKPVFNYDMIPEKSRARVREYEQAHPEFKELAERVYQYNRNLMQYRVDSGLISQEMADFLQKKYPDYVPTFHQQEGVSTAPQDKGTRVGKTVKRATGAAGNTPFVDLDKAMAQQTLNVVRESAKNRFGQRLLNKNLSQDYILNVESVAAQKQQAEMLDEDGFFAEQTNKDNTFTVYQDGKAYEITMTPEMYDGIKSLSKTGESDKMAVKVVIGANNIYKKAITSWNPFFTLKNLLKDMQDSLLYSTDLKGFATNYPKAVKEIFTGGQNWKLYQALGGTASSVYNMDEGVELPKSGPLAKVVGGISYMNLAVEQAPRLAEFMATANKGKRTQEELMEAMYNAADITTNFGRSGDWTKTLNSSFVPFLNPSIQGLDKLMRTVRDNPRTFGAWMGLIGKAAALGVAPAVINAALFGGEDDYDELNQRDLDGNFMIPGRCFDEEWDGMWLKVPRGRALAALAATANVGINLAKGKEVDAGEWIDTVWTNVGITNPLTGHILKSWNDTALFDQDDPGKTWYGSDIETTAMQNKKPGERYNEKTDIFSKALGSKLGLSPAKINYLLDSYTGVFGDIALPLLTPTNPVGKNPLAKSFVVDSTTSNRLSSAFYDLGDQLKYDEQDGSAEAAIAYDYWNKVSQELSEVNEGIRKMEKDLSLDSKEKRKKYRDLKAQANEIIRAGMKNVNAFQKAAAQYGKITEDNERDVFLKVTREVLGAEKALEFEGKDVYEKAQKAHEAGVSYDTYLDFRTLRKQYDTIDSVEKKLAAMEEEGITGLERDMLEWQARLMTDSEDAKSVRSRYTGIGNGWKPAEKDEELALVDSMELAEEESFALWKAVVADQYDLEEIEELEIKGLPPMDYYRYRQAVKFLHGEEDPDEAGKTKSGSKQAQRLQAINAMKLTTKQKDLLWFANDWSASTLYKKAPWH